MNVSRTYDVEMIKEMITRDCIWSTIAEDGQVKEDYSPKVDAECWLEMKADDVLVGLYNLHSHNAITVQIHAHVLPEHRKKHSKATGIGSLRWIYDNAPVYKKVVAQIPFCYENVKNFTMSMGFKLEGINRLSYQKNGDIIDQWQLGITRDEIKSHLT